MRRLRGRPFGNRNHPSCKDVAQVLQTFLDEELAGADIPTVQRHLDACRDCGLEAATYEALKQRLVDTRVDLEGDVLARLRAFSDSLLSDASDAS